MGFERRSSSWVSYKLQLQQSAGNEGIEGLSSERCSRDGSRFSAVGLQHAGGITKS